MFASNDVPAKNLHTMKKFKRDRRGRFIEGERTLTRIFLGVGLVYMVSMIGLNTIWGWAKSLETAFVVENSQAVEVVEDRIDYLKRKIAQKAKLYGVSAYQMERTIWCESRFNNVQSSAYYKNGQREESYGLAQIHLPDHPSVSKEEALTEEFAIEWMAKNFHNPYVTWYGYNRKTDKCN